MCVSYQYTKRILLQFSWGYVVMVVVMQAVIVVAEVQSYPSQAQHKKSFNYTQHIKIALNSRIPHKNFWLGMGTPVFI